MTEPSDPNPRDPKFTAQASSSPSSEDTDEARVESSEDLGRRRFLHTVLGLGLANVSLSFLGSVPALARSQDGGGDGDDECKIPNGDGTWNEDIDCDISGNAPDSDCGKPDGIDGHFKDSSCGAPQGEGPLGTFEKDEDCAKTSGPLDNELHSDQDCMAQKDPFSHHRDDLCGQPTGDQQPPVYIGDQACHQSTILGRHPGDLDCAKPQEDKLLKDDDCGQLKAPFSIHADSDCGKASGNTLHSDDLCLKQHSPLGGGPIVHSDSDCGIKTPTGGFSTDDDCTNTTNFQDSDCAHPPFQDSTGPQ